MIEANAKKAIAASALLIGIGLSGLSVAVHAAPTRLLLESDANAVGGAELFGATYNFRNFVCEA